MKKIIVSVIAVYLFFMFLVYSGAFRDYSNPVEVTKYYFECIKNREGFLTYQISKPEFFNEDRLGMIYKKNKMGEVVKINHKLIDLKDSYAHVQTKITYKDDRFIYLMVVLEKVGNVYLIHKVIQS